MTSNEQRVPLLALLALAGVLLLLSPPSFADGQPTDGAADHDAGDHQSVSEPTYVCCECRR